MRRWIVATVVGVALATIALPARSASAHAQLENSTPAANAVLTDSPPEIALDFDEDIDPSVASIQLHDQTTKLVSTGKPEQGADSTIVQASVGSTLGNGTYAVVWRVTSVDGHVVDGAFAFQVGTGGGVDSGGLIDEVRRGVSSPPWVGRLYGAARALSLLGFIVLCGGGAYAFSRPPLRAGTRVLRIAWLALVVGTAAAFGLYAAGVVGGTLGDVLSPSVWSDAASTHTGRMILVRLGFAGVLGVLLTMQQFAETTWWLLLALVASLVALFSFSMSGHADAQNPASLWIGIDALHLAAIAAWIGGLVLFAVGGRDWLRDESRAPVVRTFSRIATVAVPVIVGTGVLATLRLVDDLGSLTETAWGRTLLVKITLVVVVVAIGGVSRWVLHNSGPGALRRTVTTEAVLGVAIVGLAAGLIGLPPAPQAKSQPFSAALSSAGVTVDVSLSPGRVGANEVHLVITPPGGNLHPVVSTTARMTLPDANIPESPVTLNNAGANHYIGSITLPRSGTWTLDVIVEPEPAQTVSLTAQVPIP